jgi:flavin-dependent dehydrogenase
MPRCDVLVVGGSVAGAALAVHLGRLGIQVVVCDKARFPRRKTCGEGLLPHGAAELRSLGLGEPPGFPVSGLRYFGPSGDAASQRFDGCGLERGWVVHRDRFDRWLLDHARATPNVTVREDTPVAQVVVDEGGVVAASVRARIVVGADGLHSILHRFGPFRRIEPNRRRVGMSAVVAGYPAGDMVDVHLGKGGEAYVGPTGSGEVSLALLLERGTRPEDLIASIPALRDIRIGQPFIGAGPLGVRVAPVVHGRMLLLGDAAGAVDPISGEGMSLALLSARAAAAPIREAIETGDFGALDRYAEARRKLMAPASRMAGLILRMTKHPWLADRVVRKLAHDAPLFGRLLRAACGAGSLGLLEPARLVL